MSPVDPQVPPAGEEVHLPGPTLLPLGLAVGLTLLIVGVTVGMVFWIPGALLTIFTLARWIADTRREMAELPLEHHH